MFGGHLFLMCVCSVNVGIWRLSASFPRDVTSSLFNYWLRLYKIESLMCSHASEQLLWSQLATECHFSPDVAAYCRHKQGGSCEAAQQNLICLLLVRIAWHYLSWQMLYLLPFWSCIQPRSYSCFCVYVSLCVAKVYYLSYFHVFMSNSNLFLM